MRVLPVLLLTVALATSAGCFGKDDPGDDPPTTTTPMGTTPTGSTPTGTTPTTPTTGGNTTTPPPILPRELCTVSFDFTQNVQPAAPPTTITTGACGAVGAGYRNAVMNLTFNAASGAPVFVTQGVSVALLDSAGTAVTTCNGPSAGQAVATPATCTASVTPGDYSLQFNGVGPITVAGNVMIS